MIHLIINEQVKARSHLIGANHPGLRKEGGVCMEP